MITSLFLSSLFAQQLIGGWSYSGPHEEASAVQAIEQTIAKNKALNNFIDLGQDNLFGSFSLPSGLDSNNSASVFYKCSLKSDTEQYVRLRMGSDDGLNVWLNGELLINNESLERVYNSSEEHPILPLKKGANTLVIKIKSKKPTQWFFSINREITADPIAVDQAIRKGVQYLKSIQLADGSWSYHNTAYRNGATSLAIYTLLKCGVPPGDPSIIKGLSYISATYPEKTYSAGCQLMALAELNDKQYFDQMEVITSDLISWQEQNGAWAYPAGHFDLSCTQFAILGLRAATSVGIDVPKRVWINAFEGVMVCSDGEKGFLYYPNSPYSVLGTQAMTTAAVSTMTICKEQLGGKYPQKIRKDADRAVKEGVEWIAKNFTVAKNHGQINGSHRYYSMYGVERVASLLGLNFFGNHDWYNEGANFLIEAQSGDGSWYYSHGSPQTCYALLFLKRATGKKAVTRRQGQASSSNEIVSEDDGGLVVHASYSDPVILWTKVPEGIKGEGPVKYFIKRKENQAWKEIGEGSGSRQALNYSFNIPGKWLIQAQINANGELLSSKQFTYLAMPSLREGDGTHGADEFDNLILRNRPTGTVSSSASASFNADKLFDGNLWTRWLTKSNDKAPEASIQLKRSAKTTGIQFTHTYNSIVEANDYARPSEVALYINNEKEPIIVTINPDTTRKSIYKFKKKLSVRKIRIVVTKILDGELGKASIGFSEIELMP